MEITLEQVEHLREKANVSYGQAKAALEYSGGNLLDALIYLEEKGIIPRPEDAYYSTKSEAVPPPQELTELSVNAPKPYKTAKQGRTGRHRPRRLLSWLRRILLDNELEIWRKGQPITAIPMLIFLILIFCLFYVTIPLLILGLFLGFRYQIAGPDLENEALNHMMDSAANTASEVGRQVMDELKSQQDKYNNHKK